MPKSKYKAVKTFQHGRYWPSKLELAVYEMLLMMQRGGKIKDLKCQVRVRFHTYEYGNTVMIPDFSAFDIKTEQTIYIEAKGYPTREWLRKKKAWGVGGPGNLYVYTGSWKYPKLSMIIVPQGGKNEERLSAG